MPSPDLQSESERQFTICNACRYCESYCAVFPAIELRRHFAPADVDYIASLCHDCRACYYACQYAPPHEFALNLPRLLGEVRMETHMQHSQPPRTPGSASAGTWTSLLIALITLAAGLAFVLATKGAHALVTAHVGSGAFYKVVPESVMDIVFLALGLFWLMAWFDSGRRFWQATSAADHGGHLSVPVLLRAAGAAFKLTYLGGGGEGCAYPSATPSGARRILHQIVFYGFLLDLLSTMLAAFDDHVLGILAPYPLWSPVVLLGSLGGLGLVAGTAGFLLVNARADMGLTSPSQVRMDTAFLLSLLLVAATGIGLLVLRTTALMGALLIIHLATVVALFLTAPYGKFVHLVYRCLSLVRFEMENDEHSA